MTALNLTVVLWPEDDGREVVYHPANRLAEALCGFAGTPVLRQNRLRHLEAIGFTVRLHTGRLPGPDRKAGAGGG